ncbi:MAG TPA: hypothetical protein VLH08_01080 [Acidobacteriota bacterium]|nr:hypothetical protein [Acidobacteriota bacterium]
MRGNYLILVLIIILSVVIHPVSKRDVLPFKTKNDLALMNREDQGIGIEKFMPERSLVKIGYTADSPYKNESYDLSSEPGECSLYIYCRPTGAINPSVHCFIITHDRREADPIITKFTAGPDPKRRGLIASWRVERSKEKITHDVRCIQCSNDNDIPCYKIECLRKHTKEFNDSRFKYDYSATKGPNSNSFVTGILDKCGLSLSAVEFPDGATGYEYVFN